MKHYFLCVLSRLHQQEERAEEEEGVVLRGASSSCHHSVLLWWALLHKLNTLHRENVQFKHIKHTKHVLSDQLLLVSRTGMASSRVIAVA